VKQLTPKGRNFVGTSAVSYDELITFFAVLAIATVSVLPHLGTTCLWEDEAQTALVARNILSQGVPAASDGKNSVSIFADHRDVRNGIHIWQGWFPSYLAAASMAVWGDNAFGARFPFAVAFVAFVGFYYRFLRKRGDRNRHLWLTIFLTVTCVPLLLHARQCRYYVLVPLLNLLIVDAYLDFLNDGNPRYQILLAIWMTLLLNSFFPGAFLLGLALGVDLLRRRPPPAKLKKLAILATVVLILNLPMALFCRIWNRQFATESIFHDPSAWGTFLLRYLIMLNDYCFPLILVVLAFALKWKDIRQRRFFRDDVSFLFAAIILTQLIGFSVVSDLPFTRYIIGIVPFLMFFFARCLETISFNRTWLSWVLPVVVVGTNLLHVLPLPLLRQTRLQNAQWTTAGIDPNFIDSNRIRFSFARGEVKTLINVHVGFPLVDYIRSIVRPPLGPDDVIVDYLRTNAAPGDRVKPSYGAQTLMFHTDLTIINPTEIGPFGPEWMILRRFRPLKTNEEFMRESNKYPYTKVTIPFPDLQWNNQPDPLYHYYDRPSDDLAPPITVLKKL
jgi:hypothetical protein